MKLSDKVYDFLKWLVAPVLPALLAFYGIIGNTLALPYTEEVLTIGAAGITCLGTILGISSYNYKKTK